MSARNYDGFMPAEIAAALREIGAEIEAEKTAAIYAPLHPAQPETGIRVERDLSYGPDGRNTLDVFTRAAAGEARPVLVFVYGGGFRGGAKSTAGTPFYDNVMRWAVEQDMVGVNVNYRLAPDNMWPSGIQDIERVLTWVRRNIAARGGDPGQIILWGHSSGGALASVRRVRGRHIRPFLNRSRSQIYQQCTNRLIRMGHRVEIPMLEEACLSSVVQALSRRY